MSQFFISGGDASHLKRYCHAHGDHKRVEKHHEHHEKQPEQPFEQMEDEVPLVVRVAGHQKVHVVRVEVVVASRSVVVSDRHLFKDVE